MTRRHSVSLRPQTKGIDRPLLFITLALVAFGLVMILNVSVVEATRIFGDKFYFAKKQVLWVLAGVFSMFFLSRIPPKFFERIAVPLFFFTVFLLIAVFIPGIGLSISGARRWIGIGPLIVQPSELAKFSLVLYSAYLFSKQRHILSFLFAVGVIIGLVAIEPDLGTALVLGATAVIIYFASGAPIAYFLGIIPLLGALTLFFALGSEYRRARIFTFLNPSSDPLGTSYHIRQILIALGSGGLFGVGLGQSRQKYLFLPEPTTDSIFAIIGEELGFLGASLVLCAFLFFIVRGLIIASRLESRFSRLLAAGIVGWIGSQAFVNLAAMVALIPLTGIPLPFVSYGGSSLVAALSGVGILLSLSRNQEKRR